MDEINFFYLKCQKILLVKEFSQFFPLYPYWHLQVYELASLLHKPPFLQGLSEHLRTLGAKVVVKVSPSKKKVIYVLKNYFN